METFTGTEYIQIAIANAYGYDKCSWQDRLKFTRTSVFDGSATEEEAEDPFQFISAKHALKDALNKVPTGYIMSLDATASGLQIMACLSGCRKTAALVNLGTTDRVDIYSIVTEEINKRIGSTLVRADIKKNVMTKYYNKSRPEGLTWKQEQTFNEVLEDLCPGPEWVMQSINKAWNATAMEHRWATPDNHEAVVPVVEVVSTRIEVDELDHMTFTYCHESNQPTTRYLSLVPNVIHSLDGWVAREMVRRAAKEGFQLAHIHDSFWASPNNMNKVRKIYLDVLAVLAEFNFMESFFEGRKTSLTPYKNKEPLTDLIQNSEYALS